jgi:hypothetical protein
MYLTDGVEGGETHFPRVSWCTNLSCNQTEQSVPVNVVCACLEL